MFNLKFYDTCFHRTFQEKGTAPGEATASTASRTAMKKITFAFLKARMEKWRDSQENNRWSKYKDAPGTSSEKKNHQDCILQDIVRDLKAHNVGRSRSEAWHIHGWYNRWIHGDSGTYFVTVARIRKGKDGETRTHLGDTMVSLKQFRKDTLLATIRRAARPFMLPLLGINSWKLTADKTKRLKELIETRSYGKELTINLELLGLKLLTALAFIDALVSWMEQLDKMKPPVWVNGQYRNWMDFFLSSGYDTKEFCHMCCEYAPDDCFGMFRKPFVEAA